jgi:soluble lytic murein transglycosylase-like protein
VTKREAYTIWHAPWWGVLCAFVFSAGDPARAQVLEIGSDEVVVYDRPAVFTTSGVVPIAQASIDLPASPSSQRVIGRNLAAAAADLSPALIEAVAWNESRLRSGVVSAAGAIGEMQLMPATARDLGVDPTDSRQNYFGGAAYLRAMLRRYGGDLQLALAAYNAGPGSVDRYGGVPPFKETRAYVAAIMARLSAKASESPR